MFEEELSSLLDILGNRNRRRIIELLRDKPCFVTEISDRLMISPKAVIDHLLMLEEAQILTYKHDEKRRKYYYLEHDINIQVQVEKQEQGLVPVTLSNEQRFLLELQKLWQMISQRGELVTRLEELEYEIDQQIGMVLSEGKKVGEDETDLLVCIALAHGARTPTDIRNITEISAEEVKQTLELLVEEGIACRKGTGYRLRGIYAE